MDVVLSSNHSRSFWSACFSGFAELLGTNQVHFGRHLIHNVPKYKHSVKGSIVNVREAHLTHFIRSP